MAFFDRIEHETLANLGVTGRESEEMFGFGWILKDEICGIIEGWSEDSELSDTSNRTRITLKSGQEYTSCETIQSFIERFNQ